MSIDDTIFDIGDIIDTLPKETGAKESFSELCRYIARLELENESLTKENNAMRIVINMLSKE